MDRLTGEKNSSVFSRVRTQEIIERLEAYEDTGKTPEEIRELEIRSMSLADKAMYLMGELLNERKKTRWISVSEQMPEPENCILVSFDNATVPDIATYRVDDDGSGAFYPRDLDYTYLSAGLFVNAWMPLPETYRKE